jgi:hypothetical protein
MSDRDEVGSDAVYDAGNQIARELPELLPAGHAEIATRLDMLLARANRGDDVGDEILELLASTEPTRRRIDELLPVEEFDKALTDVPDFPGFGDPVEAIVYACPQCDYEYPVVEVGEVVPACPRDGNTLSPR